MNAYQRRRAKRGHYPRRGLRRLRQQVAWRIREAYVGKMRQEFDRARISFMVRYAGAVDRALEHDTGTPFFASTTLKGRR